MFFVLLDELAVNSRDIIKAIDIGRRSQFCQVVITGFIFCQKDDLVAIVSSGFVFMIFAHIKFTAYNRLDFLIVLYLSIVPINRFDKMKGAH